MLKAEISKNFGQKTVSGQLNKVLRMLIADGSVNYTIPDKPGSRLQKYYLTEKGLTALSKPSTGGTEE